MNLQKPSLPNINPAFIIWPSVTVAGLAIVLTWLVVGWDLFVSPVFNLPTLSAAEATGLLMLIAPFVAIAVGLRESKS